MSADVNGPDGTDGPGGPDGPDGADGPDGTDGPDGADGAAAVTVSGLTVATVRQHGTVLQDLDLRVGAAE